MAKQTDLNEIRRLAVNFLHLNPKPTPISVIVDHPYISSAYIPSVDNRDKIFNVMEDDIEWVKYKTMLGNKLWESDLNGILALMLNKYHLAFIKYAKPYMSKKDFDTYLAYIWIASENPNQDANVKIRTLISWFKAANKKYLMEPDELRYYTNLPDIVKVYRGVAVGRAANDGLSWTGNIKTAQWFASRFGKGGYIIQGDINKQDIFAYFNGRGEDELLCNSSKVYNKSVIKT